jgi:Ca2+-binding RTX toxin-like protein
MKKLLAALLVFANVACSPPDNVEAIRSPLLLVYTNTFATGTNSLLAVAGNLTCGGGISTCPYLVFWRPSDSACQLFSLSNTPTYMDADIRIEAGAALWANMQILGQAQTANVYCSNYSTTYTFSMLQQGGHTVDVHGTTSTTYGDWLNCSGTPGSYISCHGYAGNDLMEIDGNKNVTLDGGDGNDRLRVNSLPLGPGAPTLYGGNGEDCLYSPSAASWRDCGSGFDTSNMSGQSCEYVTQTTCP